MCWSFVFPETAADVVVIEKESFYETRAAVCLTCDQSNNPFPGNEVWDPHISVVGGVAGLADSKGLPEPCGV